MTPEQAQKLLEESSYQGNPNIKPLGVKIPFTPEQGKELHRCATDPVYFIKNYIRIVHVDKGLIPFALWDFQERIIDLYHNNRKVILKQSRQSGKSTLTVSYLLWCILFNQNERIAILANKQSTAIEILGRLQLAYMYLPKWMQQGVTEFNKARMTLENGSVIYAFSTSSDSVRGYSFTKIFLDEFAFVPNTIASQFFTSVFPTISSGNTTKIFIASTPNGMGNLYHRLWIGSENGTNDFKNFSITYDMVPGRDDAWLQEQVRNTSERQVRQEHLCKFLGSADTLIEPDILQEMIKSTKKPLFDDGRMTILENPKKDHAYVTLVDVSEGGDGDASAFTVIDITKKPYKLVAKYRNTLIAPTLYPTVIYETAKKYNDAYVLVELNSIGFVVANSLHYDFEYENILSVATKGRAGQVLSFGFGRSTNLGLKTSKATKSQGCANLKTLIENRELILEDEEVVGEVTTFVWSGRSYEAEQGNFDDLVMTLVFFGWLESQRGFEELIDPTRMLVAKQDLENLENESLTPVGYLGNDYDELEESFVAGGDRWFVVN